MGPLLHDGGAQVASSENVPAPVAVAVPSIGPELVNGISAGWELENFSGDVGTEAPLVSSAVARSVTLSPAFRFSGGTMPFTPLLVVTLRLMFAIGQTISGNGWLDVAFGREMFAVT